MNFLKHATLLRTYLLNTIAFAVGRAWHCGGITSQEMHMVYDDVLTAQRENLETDEELDEYFSE